MLFSAWPAPSKWEYMLNDWQYLASKNWDGLWMMDHFMAPNNPQDNPVSESFTSIAALGSLIDNVRIGTMVAGNTYRHPAVLAKMAVNLDHITKGRFILGIGCGWQELEHSVFGIDFPPISQRVKMLNESADILSNLLSGNEVNFSGDYYNLSQAKLSPAPLTDKIPLLIGGGGEKVTLKTVAKFADAWNIWASPSLFERKLAVLTKHCELINRDVSEIHKTVAINILFSDDRQKIQQLKTNSWSLIGGNIDEISQRIGEFINMGVNEIIVAAYNKDSYQRVSLEQLDIFSENIIPLFN
jgi:alkanesulfonate monooxygenase SsuD/methylene tetrahydromethanopterin reductase-like flavin-dependent oxidoreductase (luciferase family)